MHTHMINVIKVDPNIRFLVETAVGMKNKRNLINLLRNTFEKLVEKKN